MDSFIKTACLLFKSHRADVTKITVAAFTIVKTFNVFEHIGPCFFSSPVAYPVDPLPFHESKKTLDHRIVVTVSTSTHAAVDAVL